MDIRTRPKRRKRVVAEPYHSVTFYLPVDVMERVRVIAEQAKRSYSDTVEEALRFYLAAKIHIPDMDPSESNGHRHD